MDELTKKQNDIKRYEMDQAVLKVFYSRELKEKNHCDDHFCIHPTEMMRQLFVNKAEFYKLNIFDFKEEIAFEMITPDELNLRKITTDEYNMLSEIIKNEKPDFFKAILGSCVFLIGAVVLMFSSINSEGGNPINTALSVVFFLIFIISFMRSLKKSNMIPENSDIAIGNAVYFYSESKDVGDSSFTTYYVDVAFYDEKKIVRRIVCDEKQLKKLQLDSKVVIYDSKAYALE